MGLARSETDPLELLAGEQEFMDDICSLAFGVLDSSDLEQTAALVLDHLGVTVVGAPMPWTRTLLDTLSDAVGRSADAARTVWGEPVATHRDAALAGGTAAHGFDLDDTHLATMSHPGCSVIAAALVAADAAGARGRTLLGAIAAGYEVIGRVGSAIGLTYGEKGYHATGQIGPLGAAAAVARCLGGTPVQVQHAIALATSMGGGIKAFTAGGGDIKRLHGGRAAEAGLLAGLLACRGMAGPNRPLLGRFGLIPTISIDPPDHNGLRAQSDLVVHSTILKRYPACAALHGALAAAGHLAPLEADGIVGVEVGTSNRVIAQNLIPEPTDPMAAQYSLEWATAAALLGRGHQVDTYLGVLDDAQRDVATLAGRVAGTVDERVEQRYPQQIGAVVRVVLADGEVRTAEAFLDIADSTGQDLAVDKFRSITGELLDPATVDETIRGARRLIDDAGTDDLLRPIRSCSKLRSRLDELDPARTTTRPDNHQGSLLP